MNAEIVQVHEGKHTIVVSGTTMTVDGKESWDLTALTGVVFNSYDRYINGTLQGSEFILQVDQDKRRRVFWWSSSVGNKKFEEYRDEFIKLFDPLFAIAIPPIALATAARVRAGETVTFGGVRLSPEGVQQRRRLRMTTVPWSDVTQAYKERTSDFFTVLGRQAPGAPETVIAEIPRSERNVYALPTVVGLLKV